MIGRIAQDRTYYEIKFTIHSTIFLHFREGQISITSTRLLEIEPAYNKGQNTIILNWGSN